MCVKWVYIYCYPRALIMGKNNGFVLLIIHYMSSMSIQPQQMIEILPSSL